VGDKFATLAAFGGYGGEVDVLRKWADAIAEPALVRFPDLSRVRETQ
jgi:hypothetical protein